MEESSTRALGELGLCERWTVFAILIRFAFEGLDLLQKMLSSHSGNGLNKVSKRNECILNYRSLAKLLGHNPTNKTSNPANKY